MSENNAGGVVARWEAPPEPVTLPATDSWVPVLASVGDLATKLAVTEFVPKAMQRRPASVAAAILTGREMGLGPMASLRGIDVIEGKPRVTAEMLAARILAAGHKIEWGDTTDTRAAVRIVRGDGLSEAEAVWTKADAERANLWGKGAWAKYPRHMLRHRALTEAAGMACPDVALGLEVAADGGQPVSASPVGGSALVSVVPAGGEVVAPAGPGIGGREESPDAEAAGALIEDSNGEGDRHEEAPPEEVPPEEAPPEDDGRWNLPAIPPTPAQLRKLGAVLGEYANMVGVKMDRDERRRFVGMLLGVDDLQSVKDLNKEQVSETIDAIGALLEAGPGT